MLDKIEDAIQSVKDGKIIIVVDDENRENEGDFICAAEHITPEIINFMATHGRGLICASLTEDRCNELGLELMVGKNTSYFDTPFTVSVDLISNDTSTGISAADRAKTIRALTDPKTKPEQLGKPGHIFPLKAKKGGVLRRTGHTEAAIDFPRLAGLKPAGVLVEIMNEDGTMARLPDLRKVADRFNLRLVSIKDLIEYRLNTESLIHEEFISDVETAYGRFQLHIFKQINADDIHLALVKGSWHEDESVLVRVHSANYFEDIFGSSSGNSSIQQVLKKINAAGKGILLYMNQESMGDGLIQKLKKYTDPENQMGSNLDQRDFGIGAQILRHLHARKLLLLTNHPKKRVGLPGYGLEIIDNVPIEE
ncbi:3,4-dihydroxy-2-butanone-4-phosphate synthase [Catalinimonas niigatensis]|uniref:3,4-dihydroxy-2-butanone-4-phosphate synthase n=1 Tax=Catalinimonas niigatensis TaxID=1397264 RepID=UPI002665D866|nr:3,4-dihydroxy-2-butanone-4-phosphate synthase [Catalinimonas niigatensis]WPP50924.1 3,4-dihydroxy-2-butanone-4-phosphate synthase [Catalinimonas niigatensis]